MKRIIMTSAIVLVVMALLGCHKDAAPVAGTHKVTIVSACDGTKTGFLEKAGKSIFFWTESDKSNFHVFENGTAATSVSVSIKDSIATVTAEFEDSEAAEYEYTGFVSGSTAPEGAAPALPISQTIGDGILDPSADVLVARPKRTLGVATSLTFAYRRTAAVGKMTLKNIPAGETVESVTISADKNITGYFDSENDKWVGQGNAISVTVGKTVPQGDSIVVCFSSMPVDSAIFTIKVSTDKKNFAKTFSRTLSLPEGRLVDFRVNMKGCEAPLFHETFDKCDGTGGNDGSWSGNIASGKLITEKLDNAGWAWENGYRGKKCIKLGTGSALGYAQSPALGLKSGLKSKVTFQAGAWSSTSEASTISLEIIGNGTLDQSSFSISKGAWTECKAVITGGDRKTRLKISATQAKNNRFFLDELKVEVGESGGGGGGGGGAGTSETAHKGWMELPGKATGSSQYYGECHVSTFRNYSYLYDKTLYAALWVAYPLCQSNTKGDGHTSSWRWNPDIDQKYQVDVKSGAYEKNYGNGSYSRGHQIPNADRKNLDSLNTQTYYVTNQTPQLQNGFNSGVWNSLENDIRGLLSSTDTVYVVTGPVYQKVGETKTITYLTSTSDNIKPAKVPVPNYYWKAILKVKRSEGVVTSAQAIGVWFEHKAYSSTTWKSFTTSVDQIESYTGFDLFANLPEAIAAAAESNTSWDTFSNF